MKTTADYLDDLRAKLNVDSDAAAARAIGITHRQQVSRYRQLHNTFDEGIALKVADTLGIKRSEVLLAMQVQREKNAEIKKIWERIATLAMGATIGLVAFFTLPFVVLPNGDAAIVASAEELSTVYYVKWLAQYWFAILPALLLAILYLPRQKSI